MAKYPMLIPTTSQLTVTYRAVFQFPRAAPYLGLQREMTPMSRLDLKFSNETMCR
jgi:hypothetical protein